MPSSTFAFLIGGVICAAALTVALLFGGITNVAWALPVAVIAALVLRYAVARSRS
ncbi:MAG: hypothetical protein AAFQ64_14660 [Pseudomonadota bacterium]